MIAGLVRGLNHEDAARFSFLLATPIIAAAGLYKVPDLFGPLGDGVRGQALVGAIFAGLAAYAAVRFLVRFFETQTLLPFACTASSRGVSASSVSGEPARRCAVASPRGRIVAVVPTARVVTARSHTTDGAPTASLVDVVREWGRIGCIGFGGPPTHIALLSGPVCPTTTVVGR